MKITGAKVQRLMKNLPGIAYSCKVDSLWTMLFLSDGCKRVTGYDPQELLENKVISYIQIIHPDDRKSVRDAVLSAVDIGNFFEIEYRIVTKEGDIKWVWERGSTVFDDDSGEKTLEGFISDITDRKLAEQKTRAAKNKYEALLNHLQSGVFYINCQGEIQETNVALIEIMGSPSVEETRKINIFEFQPLIDFGYTGKLKECIKTGKIVYGDGVYESKWGKKIYIEYYFAPIKSDDRVEGVLASIEDVTLKKRDEEELLKVQKLESIGTLAGGIAHDFNNLLTMIFGNITLAKIKLPDDHPSKKKLDKAEQAIDRAVSLTRQLLTFSKGGEPLKETLNIEQLVRETVMFDLSGSNIKPQIIAQNELMAVDADKGQLHQVFSNLTMNAKQAMPEGGILKVFLENHRVEENEIAGLVEGDYVKIAFQDEGSGIEEKYLEKIFYPYFTTKQSGSGLGLSVVFSIIKKHGGKIFVESELGQGSCFNIYLSAVKNGSEKAVDNNKTDSVTLSSRMKVLVMDDEQPILDLINDILKSDGWEVITVSDGTDAIKEYRKASVSGKQFDVVIMDLTIPGGLGGLEAVGTILDIDRDVKCIVSSGYASDSIMANYEKYGFKAAIAKPFKVGELINVVNRVSGMN